jgi:hypothetical protein
VELVPNQNSFGHFHRWLKHAAYRKYAEVTPRLPPLWARTQQSCACVRACG